MVFIRPRSWVQTLCELIIQCWVKPCIVCLSKGLASRTIFTRQKFMKEFITLFKPQIQHKCNSLFLSQKNKREQRLGCSLNMDVPIMFDSSHSLQCPVVSCKLCFCMQTYRSQKHLCLSTTIPIFVVKSNNAKYPPSLLLDIG